MLTSLLSSPLLLIIWLVGLVVTLTIHEFAHAWTADKLGDPTPRAQGRVTLNPLVHLDPLGTIALIVFRFGWGKPVEFDPYNLKNPVRDGAMIALAGPAVNLVFAAILAVLLRGGVIGNALLQFAAVQTLMLNLVLAIFNLIPVYPLDGSKILLALLPRLAAIEYDEFMRHYGIYVLLLLVFPWYQGSSPVSFLIWPIIERLGTLLLGS